MLIDEMVQAAKAGNISEVQKLLNNGAPVDRKHTKKSKLREIVQRLRHSVSSQSLNKNIDTDMDDNLTFEDVENRVLPLTKLLMKVTEK